eukprot:365086-Chlamydomonas_euryale.AAC.10
MLWEVQHESNRQLWLTHAGKSTAPEHAAPEHAASAHAASEHAASEHAASQHAAREHDASEHAAPALTCQLGDQLQGLERWWTGVAWRAFAHMQLHGAPMQPRLLLVWLWQDQGAVQHNVVKNLRVQRQKSARATSAEGWRAGAGRGRRAAPPGPRRLPRTPAPEYASGAVLHNPWPLPHNSHNLFTERPSVDHLPDHAQMRVLGLRRGRPRGRARHARAVVGGAAAIVAGVGLVDVCCLRRASGVFQDCPSRSSPHALAVWVRTWEGRKDERDARLRLTPLDVP